jgi:hypothetical protein
MGHSGRNAPPLNGNNPLRYEADLKEWGGMNKEKKPVP